MTASSTHGERTKAAILRTGLALMCADPGTVTARRIGKALRMTHSAILYHYGTSQGLRDAVAAHAVAERCEAVIPYLIATRHPAVADMPGADRRRYLRTVD